MMAEEDNTNNYATNSDLESELNSLGNTQEAGTSNTTSEDNDQQNGNSQNEEEVFDLDALAGDDDGEEKRDTQTQESPEKQTDTASTESEASSASQASNISSNANEGAFDLDAALRGEASSSSNNSKPDSDDATQIKKEDASASLSNEKKLSTNNSDNESIPQKKQQPPEIEEQKPFSSGSISTSPEIATGEQTDVETQEEHQKDTGEKLHELFEEATTQSSDQPASQAQSIRQDEVNEQKSSSTHSTPPTSDAETNKEAVDTQSTDAKHTPENQGVDTAETEKHEQEDKEQARTPPTEVETYYKDISSYMEKGDPNDMSQVLQEMHEKEAEEKEKEKNKKSVTFMSIIIIILLAAGIGLLYFALAPNNKPTETKPDTVSSLIRTDNKTFVDGTSASHFKLKSLAQDTISKHTTPDSIHHIYFGTRADGGKVFTSKEWFNTLELHAPKKLTKTLHPKYMFGTYNTTQPHPFILLQVSSYPDAFEGMKEWEDDMFRDLRHLFNIPQKLDTPEARQADFTTTTIHNRQVRALDIPVIATSTEQVRLMPPTSSTETKTDTLQETSSIATSTNGTTATNTTTATTNSATMTTTDTSTMTSASPATTITTKSTSNATVTTTSIATKTTQDDTQTKPEIITRINRSIVDRERVIIYTFLSESVLLITSHSDVLPEMIERLGNRELFNE